MLGDGTVRDWADFRTGGVHYVGATQLGSKAPKDGHQGGTHPTKTQKRKVDPVLVSPVPIVLDEERRVKTSGKKRAQINALILASVKQIVYDRTSRVTVKQTELSGWTNVLLTDYVGVGFEKEADRRVDHRTVVPKLFLWVDNGDGFITCNFNKTAYKRKFVSSSVDPEKMDLLYAKSCNYATPGSFTYGNMVRDRLVLKGTRNGKSFDIPFADPKYLAPMVAEYIASGAGACEFPPGMLYGALSPDMESEYPYRTSFSTFYSSYLSFELPKDDDGQKVPTPGSCNRVLGNNMRKISTDPKFYNHFNGRDATVLSEHVGWNRPFGGAFSVFPEEGDPRDNLERMLDDLDDLSVPSGGEVAMGVMQEGWIPDCYAPIYGAWKAAIDSK